MQLFSEHLIKDHILSKIDARVKIVCALVLLGMVLSYRGYVFPLVVLFTSFILCLVIKAPLRLVLLRFAEPLFIIAMVILLKFLFTGQEEIFSINLAGLKITGHIDGLMEGLKIAGRILGAVSIITVLGFVTPFTEIIAGLSWFRIPGGFIEILMFAYRYIFLLLEDAFVIYQAQKNRLGYIDMRKGLNSFGLLAGTLVIRSFDQSQKTALAMIQRGYTGNMPGLKHSPLKMGEAALALLFIIFAGAIWMIQ